MDYNKLQPQANALAEKVFRDGLARYTQPNCQVDLTNRGYHIYRPPNLTTANNGNTMWGGLILKPFTTDEDFLIKDHTYIIMLHVSGQSTDHFTDVYWSNNVGWGGGSYGLTTETSNVLITNIPDNFKGEEEFSYKFTVSGDVWKTCTKSYSGFKEGTSYNCYRDLKIGFGYRSTGELGTDLYITNLRCYDITEPTNVISVQKTGIILAGEFTEGDQSQTKFFSGGEILSNEFIEY